MCSIPGPILEVQQGPWPVYPRKSASSKRLKWSLNGPLESAIQVAPNQYYEPGDIFEPYFRPDLEPELAWHPVSQESLTQPPVQDAKVRIRCVDDWEELWVELNRYCTNTKTDPRRPRTEHIQLNVATSGEFLTIHEYVSAVHPWLMGLRGRLLHDLGMQTLDRPWPDDTDLVVSSFGDAPLAVEKEEEWARWHKKPDIRPYVPLSAAEREKASEQAIQRQLARSAARVRELERLRQEKNNGDGA
ncbi:hypothetical protein CPLU01_08526 [Colletotrichum plurivorum]|uniref:Uncharacterized protein n=1 Tax=Colletotrichum plurivorum TaxID=2175906 RepID=A0A8H6KCJ7_9PEZI|nr:hypothetical protein CPLU01_08526 [Colletotrichum plurivorum]